MTPSVAYSTQCMLRDMQTPWPYGLRRNCVGADTCHGTGATAAAVKGSIAVLHRITLSCTFAGLQPPTRSSQVDTFNTHPGRTAQHNHIRHIRGGVGQSWLPVVALRKGLVPTHSPKRMQPDPSGLTNRTGSC